VTEYREGLRRLAELDHEAAAHRDEARRWHDRGSAAADAAVQAAEQALHDAEHDVQAAQRDLEAVDARAAGLWLDFVYRAGPPAERFGRATPAPMVPRQRAGDDELGAEEYLQEAAQRVTYTRPAQPVTNATQLLFSALGALGGAIGVGAARTLRWAGHTGGGDWAVGLPVVALIVMLLGPALGVGAAKLVAERRGVGLDPSAVAVTLLSGLVAVAVLYAALPR
jgi:hypothetical protein